MMTVILMIIMSQIMFVVCKRAHAQLQAAHDVLTVIAKSMPMHLVCQALSLLSLCWQHGDEEDDLILTTRRYASLRSFGVRVAAWATSKQIDITLRKAVQSPCASWCTLFASPTTPASCKQLTGARKSVQKQSSGLGNTCQAIIV